MQKNVLYIYSGNWVVTKPLLPIISRVPPLKPLNVTSTTITFPQQPLK